MSFSFFGFCGVEISSNFTYRLIFVSKSFSNFLYSVLSSPPFDFTAMMAVGMGKHSRLFLILFASNFVADFSSRDDALAVVDDVAAPRENNARGFDARSHHRRGGRIRRRHRGGRARVVARPVSSPTATSSSYRRHFFFSSSFFWRKKRKSGKKCGFFFCVKFEKKK